MNLAQKSLLWTFLITLILTLFAPIACPLLYLSYFAPFLIVLYYQKPFLISLWGSLLCGLIIDLLSSKTPLGFYALNYTLATSLLYHHRQNFFGDSLSTLPVMVFFFASLSSLMQTGLMYVFEKQFALSWHWVANDLIVMPAYEGAFAFILFILPWRLLGKQPRKGREYFSN